MFEKAAIPKQHLQPPLCAMGIQSSVSPTGPVQSTLCAKGLGFNAVFLFTSVAERSRRFLRTCHGLGKWSSHSTIHGVVLWMDEIHVAPPKKPSRLVSDDFLPTKHGFPWFQSGKRKISSTRWLVPVFVFHPFQHSVIWLWVNTIASHFGWDW